MDRSVGFPVKKRETSEPNEWLSLKPNMSNTTPNANMARPIVFIPKSHSKRDSGIGEFTVKRPPLRHRVKSERHRLAGVGIDLRSEVAAIS